MHPFRSHSCADLNASNVGETVRLSGWVHRVRDHGGVLFIDLRDHYGVTQVLCDPDSPVFAEVEKVRSEWCIRIDGNVKARDESLINPKIPTGEVEVFIRDMEVLGSAKELPLMVFGDQEYPEETRLRYRYLDLRREQMQRNMTLRSDVIASMRQRMWERKFREYQTPIITASSPEGARDFLVPSRLHPGKFYALPQAPQQFKQLLMVSGFDKYFQIAPCFRDEDPRADRSPTDFYQLDLEMSFVTQQDVFDTIAPVIGGVFEEFGEGRKVDDPAEWPQITYADAALKYGTDKPDLRNPIEMQDVSDHFRGSGFAIFAKLLEQEGTEIRAIPAPTGGSRKFCDRMNAFAQKEGLPGMGYIFWRDQGQGMEAAGPLAKNIGPERTEAIRQQLGLGVGDAAFFLGGKPAAFQRVAGKARDVIGDRLGHQQGYPAAHRGSDQDLRALGQLGYRGAGVLGPVTDTACGKLAITFAVTGIVKPQISPALALCPLFKRHGFGAHHVGFEPAQKHNPRPCALGAAIGDTAALGRGQKGGIGHGALSFPMVLSWGEACLNPLAAPSRANYMLPYCHVTIESHIRPLWTRFSKPSTIRPAAPCWMPCVKKTGKA